MNLRLSGQPDDTSAPGGTRAGSLDYDEHARWQIGIRRMSTLEALERDATRPVGTPSAVGDAGEAELWVGQWWDVHRQEAGGLTAANSAAKLSQKLADQVEAWAWEHNQGRLPGRLLFNRPELGEAFAPFETVGCDLEESRKLADIEELLNAASLAILFRRVQQNPLEVLDRLGVGETPSMLDGWGVQPYHLKLFYEAAGFLGFVKPWENLPADLIVEVIKPKPPSGMRFVVVRRAGPTMRVNFFTSVRQAKAARSAPTQTDLQRQLKERSAWVLHYDMESGAHPVDLQAMDRVGEIATDVDGTLAVPTLKQLALQTVKRASRTRLNFVTSVLSGLARMAVSAERDEERGVITYDVEFRFEQGAGEARVMFEIDSLED